MEGSASGSVQIITDPDREAQKDSDPNDFLYETDDFLLYTIACEILFTCAESLQNSHLKEEIGDEENCASTDHAYSSLHDSLPSSYHPSPEKDAENVRLDHSYSKKLAGEEAGAASGRIEDETDAYSTLMLDLSRANARISYGLRISDKSSRFLVTHVVPGSPADTAGFMPQVSKTTVSLR
jgi:hypothetical protein